MFGKNKMQEIVLTKATMFILSYGQQAIEHVWQGERKTIVHATIFFKEKEEGKYTYLECEYSATVFDRGTLVEVSLKTDLSHGSSRNVWDWTPVNHITFQVRSIRALKGISLRFDVHASWRDVPVACIESYSRTVEDLKTVQRELGLGSSVTG